MDSIIKTKNDFLKTRDQLFHKGLKQVDSLKFSMEYSLLVEEYIRELAGGKRYKFVVASAGSFSRRELSPYSDIDLMFIADSISENEKEISRLVTQFWDSGIEVSHTAREFSDIDKYLLTDLHTFTQFFETRYLLGSERIYKSWNKVLLETISDEIKNKLLIALFEDLKLRYNKYGNSPKVLEPNIKLTAGGLRDFQAVEWMYIFRNKEFLNKQAETTQAEAFIQSLLEDKITSKDECKRLLESYKLLLAIRNLLHINSGQKIDRFEFSAQKKIAEIFGYKEQKLTQFMRKYFKAANVLNRFSKSMVKKFTEEITAPIPSSLAILLDDDYKLTGKIISLNNKSDLSFSDILRAFYYRGLYSARFDENLRTAIIEMVEGFEGLPNTGAESSVFFREILKLTRNVGSTLTAMNELGVLGTLMPEFAELNGFLQHGVYHLYTTDEHTLMTIKNVETLDKKSSQLAKIYNRLTDREILFLALLFHDIAKPINIPGHEIIGVEMASSIMHWLGYSEEEIDKVSFLVKNHLVMEQVAFRRNLSDPETLNNFTSLFSTIEELDLLYLLTYADLSAVNPAVWTNWKRDLLSELYSKSHAMLEEQITGEELLISSTYLIPKDISQYSDSITEAHAQEHIDSINDIGYANQFSVKEIARHIEEIGKGINLSVLFKDISGFTNITVITKDFPSLLSKICGVFAINGVNIHDAKIFTRKDGIVIDTFNVTDFRTHQKIEEERYLQIESDLKKVVSGLMQLSKEVASMKTKWWRIESKLFKRSGQVKIVFEKHEKYTIIDVSSPDRLGFLYQVTSKMNELGLNIYFAKISTKGDDIVDSFYVLDRNGNKISPNDYEFIKAELTSSISQIL
ncbi:bifunctional uridylyltransferase/uridylyl-removing enzyme [bacterium BMS3Abin03]|nr:bifunctional uridylyltransferase/uridylyl-removing enzyme [bacterium BMS3Abin03]